MAKSPSSERSAVQWRPIPAQTERRGGAGPVGGLLGGKDPTGRFVCVLVKPTNSGYRRGELAGS